MNITVKEAGDYFRGLLLLIAKDRRISAEEVDLMHHVGKSLGFEKHFYENAITEILENKFIVPLPPVFTSAELARCFIRDGLKLAASDGEIHPFEEHFLQSTAELNELKQEWFDQEKNRATLAGNRDTHLEVDNMVVT